MAKDVFHFLDFSMRQAPSGQRVNTDSCVFGALIGADARPARILDIGTGTGVLALMLASRFPDARITAVEPEPLIADVAAENFAASPWSTRVDLVRARAQDLSSDLHGQFDFVLCNPPYFQNSLLSDDHLRMVARHNMDLTPEELYEAMSRLVTKDGSVWLSFPGDSVSLWTERGAASGLSATHHITVKDHPDARQHMVVMGWSHQPTDAIHSDTIHYRERHQGPMSEWMRGFRERWYPARYNAQFL